MSDFSSIEFEQKRLQKALEAADIGIWDFDPATGIITWSRKCYQLFGLDPKKTVTLDLFLSCIHPEDRQRAVETINDALSPVKGGSVDMEYRVICREDGVIHWVRVNGKTFYDEKGNAIQVTGILSDITREKNTQSRVKDKERLVRNIADSAPVALFIADKNGVSTFFNQTWTDWTGLSLEESINRGWLTAVLPEDKPLTIKNLDFATSNRIYFNIDFRIIDKNGSIRWCLAEGQPRFSENGEFLGFTGSCVDITERKQSEKSYQFKTALLEAQNEATDNGILTVDAKGKILSYNKRFVEIWNLPPEITDAKDDFAALEFAREQVIEPNDFLEKVIYLYAHPDQTVEDELYLKNGHILQRYGRPVNGTDGTNYGWVWYFTDVTQAKRKEQALKFKTALLEAEQEVSPDGILITDSRGKLIMSNSRYAELWDLPKQMLNEDTEAMLLHGSNQLINPEAGLKKVKEAYANPNSIIEDEEIYLKNGRILERKARPIIGADHTYYGWAWYFRDITEQKLAEQKLQQKNKELKKIMQEFKFVTDFIPQMAWSSDAYGNQNFFNKQWYEYSGLTFEQSTGEGWSHILYPADKERSLNKWYHSLKTGEPFEIEYRLRRNDGVYRWFLGRAFPLKGPNGKIMKWFGTCTDIQDQKMLTDLLEQKVEERTQELQAANTNLERSNKELEQFAYIASHDLQEPLRKIRTFIDMMNIELENGHLDAAQQIIQKVNASSSRMNDLIKDLLNFSRLNLSQSNTFEKTDLNVILKLILEDLELAIAQKGAQIKNDPLPVINAIPLQMSQLFYNLINNSIKFSKKGLPPIIKITSRQLSQEEKANFPNLDARRNYFELIFRDNGIGFSQEYAKQIFTIFQRLHSRSAYEGTGIGLALCKKIALNHQGDIYAVSEEEKGAEFHVILPE